MTAFMPDDELLRERMRKKTAPPAGVGGWLEFFCFALTVLGPLAGLGQMVLAYDQAKPAFARLPSLQPIVLFEDVGFSILLVYGLVVGVAIWRGHLRGDRIAKRFLVVHLFGVIAIELVVLTLASGLPPKVITAVTEGVVRVIFSEGVFFFIWWTYFKRSARVRNTYGLIIANKPTEGTAASD
jgi:hypothetical protein